MKTRLTVVLEDLRIASPCSADWDDMSGTDRVRFCGKCEKNVYNLSAMSRDEGEQLIRDTEGRVCIRMYQRADGTVITTDCPVGVRKKQLRHRVWMSFSRAAASAAIVFGVFAGRARADLTIKTGTDKPQPAQALPKPPMMGGAVAAPQPPTPPKMGKPAAPPEPVEPPLMGKIAMPEHPAQPKHPTMGHVAVKPPAKPVVIETMGEPARVVMGDVAAPTPLPQQQPEAPKPSTK